METKTQSLNERIVALREKTGAGMMDCKRALDEAGGDFSKAVETLRKKGLADAAKKSSRTVKEGIIAAAVTPDGRRGAMIELDCETDFVAKTEDFRSLAGALARKAAEGRLSVPEEAAADIGPAVAKLGENIALRRLERFSLEGPGLLAHYIHPVGYKKGAFLQLGCASDRAARSEAAAELAKELGLQVAAMSPRWLGKPDVPADAVEKEREIYAAQLKAEGKPESSIPKILDGKLQKLFFQAFCLLEMVSIRDNKTPLAKLIADASLKAGGEIRVLRFARYQLGE